MALGDRVAKTIAARVAKLSGHVDVGFMEDATYPDGTPVAAVAFWNNYGTTTAPPRPFFSNMVEEQKPAWGGKVAKLVKATNGDGAKVLALMGEDIQGELIQSIRDTTNPLNAPYTIKKKGFNKPLIDTAHMINSSTYRVIK
jgi:hypothetical protein